MALNGQGNALLGTLFGLAIGSAFPKENARGGRGSSAAGNAAASYGYGNFNDTLDTADSLLTQPVQPSATDTIQPLSAAAPSEPSQPGDVSFQYNPSDFGPELQKDKMDTAVGDAAQATRRARVQKAMIEASRVGEVLTLRTTSRQQAAKLIRDFHQKYPDINLPAQPLTSDQAAQLRGKALLSRAQDQAEKQGLGRDFYSDVDPKTGQPIVSHAWMAANQLRREKELADRIAAEKAAVEQSKMGQSQKQDQVKALELELKSLDKVEATNPAETKSLNSRRTELLDQIKQTLVPQQQTPSKSLLNVLQGMSQQGTQTAAPPSNQSLDDGRQKARQYGVPFVRDDDDKEAIRPGNMYFDARDNQFHVRNPGGAINAGPQVAGAEAPFPETSVATINSAGQLPVEVASKPNVPLR